LVEEFFEFAAGRCGRFTISSTRPRIPITIGTISIDFLVPLRGSLGAGILLAATTLSPVPLPAVTLSTTTLSTTLALSTTSIATTATPAFLGHGGTRAHENQTHAEQGKTKILSHGVLFLGWRAKTILAGKCRT